MTVHKVDNTTENFNSTNTDSIKFSKDESTMCIHQSDTLSNIVIAGIDSITIAEVDNTPKVFMTKNITADGLIAIYEALGRKPKAGQKVGVKISTGEGVNSNHLRTALISKLVQAVGGDIIECNTLWWQQGKLKLIIKMQ